MNEGACQQGYNAPLVPQTRRGRRRMQRTGRSAHYFQEVLGRSKRYQMFSSMVGKT